MQNTLYKSKSEEFCKVVLPGFEVELSLSTNTLIDELESIIIEVYGFFLHCTFD